QVYLDGKDEQGRTKYLEADGTTKHVHKQRQQQQQSGLEKVSDESVDRGISAFSMMSDLIKLVKQTQKQVVTMDGKLSILLNLAERK
ncbi:MAG: hypothetical protein ACRD47_01580, partial [Nitrososphaeraceae archaeon]